MVEGVSSHGVPAPGLVHVTVLADHKAIADIRPTCNRSNLDLYISSYLARVVVDIRPTCNRSNLDLYISSYLARVWSISDQPVIEAT